MFALHRLLAVALLATKLPERSPMFMVISSILLFAMFVQGLLLLRATFELVRERIFSRKAFKYFVLLAFLATGITVIAFNGFAGPEWFLLSTSFATMILLTIYIIVGLIVLLHTRFSSGFGQVLLGGSLLLYGTCQMLYIILIAIVSKINAEKVLGIVDAIELLLISLIGMGMVMWLLEDERSLLAKANKELDQFLYSTSHDLRAPIASILGLTYLGKVEFQEEKARTFMDMIENRIRKLDLVIRDILSLSKSKKMELRMEPIALNDLMEDVLTDIEFNRGRTSIKLDWPKNANHSFYSDYTQIKIILSNLLGNAVKYHRLDQETPYIHVMFKEMNDAVEIKVEDNGSGIPKESISRIFEMFYRASEQTEGTGLGLYIVKEALDKLKGTIHVESKLGAGSTFTIHLNQARI